MKRTRETTLRGFVWPEESEWLDPEERWRQPRSIGLAHQRNQRETAPLAEMPPANVDETTLAMPRVSPHDCSDSRMGRLIRCVAGMHIETCGIGRAQDRFGSSHLGDGAVCHHQKVVRRQILLVFKHAILRNADTI